MGREIKRVPVDFDWPLNEVWEGYLSPDHLDGEPCERCFGGETWASRWLYQLCYRINMLAGDARDQEQGKPMHPWLAQDPHPPTGWPDFATKHRPTADIIDLIAGIAGRESDRVGGLFGGNTEYDIYKAIVKASGVEGWGTCPHCDGHGEHERYPGQRAEREAWTPTDPPTGEGWQMWETVSEGSPVSPVFATDEDLARWLTTIEGGKASGPKGRPMTIEQARGFVKAGWAPSFIGTVGGLHDGAEYVGTEAALGGGSDE